MSAPAHPSDSSAQRDAGREMLDTLGAQLGVDLQKRRWPLSDGAYVEINGADENDRYFVQVHARLDPLKVGQRHALANDVLKLTLVRDSAANMGRHPALILAMASQAAADSVRGWLREAMAMHGIDSRRDRLGLAFAPDVGNHEPGSLDRMMVVKVMDHSHSNIDPLIRVSGFLSRLGPKDLETRPERRDPGRMIEVRPSRIEFLERVERVAAEREQGAFHRIGQRDPFEAGQRPEDLPDGILSRAGPPGQADDD